MSKFICLCGLRLKKQKECDLHIKMYEDLEMKEGFPRHKIFKQHWQARLLECFFSVDIPYYLSFLAGSIINAIFVTHSGLSGWETLIESVCAGMFLVGVVNKTK